METQEIVRVLKNMKAESGSLPNDFTLYPAEIEAIDSAIAKLTATCETCKHAEVDDFEPSCIRCERVGCGFALPFGCIFHTCK